jgi:hypothetical protein
MKTGASYETCSTILGEIGPFGVAPKRRGRELHMQPFRARIKSEATGSFFAPGQSLMLA